MDERSSDWHSGLGAIVEKNLQDHDSLGQTANELLRECRTSDDTLDVENWYMLAAEAQRMQYTPAANVQPEDSLAAYKDQQYHTFQDGVQRVWVEAANTFLTTDELVDWNRNAAAALLARAWTELERQLPPGTVVTPE